MRPSSFPNARFLWLQRGRLEAAALLRRRQPSGHNHALGLSKKNDPIGLVFLSRQKIQ
jgi:hypothetical protein